MDDAEFLDPGGPGGASPGCSPWYWQLDRGGPDRRAPAPLTVRVKMLMLVQSMVSLITIGLVAARAANILA